MNKIEQQKFKTGDKVIVIEKTLTGEVFKWDGVVTNVTQAFIETKHARNPITHPQWHGYMMAYSPVWIKHYCLDNITKDSL